MFLGLVRALAEANTEAPLPEVRDAALVLRYRLLFVLYAEDRNLLPVRDSRYDYYSLREQVRGSIGLPERPRRRMQVREAYRRGLRDAEQWAREMRAREPTWERERGRTITPITHRLPQPRGPYRDGGGFER